MLFLASRVNSWNEWMNGFDMLWKPIPFYSCFIGKGGLWECGGSSGYMTVTTRGWAWYPPQGVRAEMYFVFFMPVLSAVCSYPVVKHFELHFLVWKVLYKYNFTYLLTSLQVSVVKNIVFSIHIDTENLKLFQYWFSTVSILRTIHTSWLLSLYLCY